MLRCCDYYLILWNKGGKLLEPQGLVDLAPLACRWKSEEMREGTERAQTVGYEHKTFCGDSVSRVVEKYNALGLTTSAYRAHCT
jgi:hypothetical protein